MRSSWSCLALTAFLLMGCATLDRLGLGSPSSLSTPVTQDQPRQQGVLDANAGRQAAYDQNVAQQQAPITPASSAVTAAPLRTQAVKVAVLVPLSGKSAPLGQAMVNAAQLAVFDMGIQGFELMPRDTKGSVEGAVQATKEALAAGAQLIIGPLFAADVAAVKPVVKETNVSMLALSTDVSLAEPGAYVMGFAPGPQVERVISFATSKGIRKFAALIPPGPYGQLVSRAFEDEVKANGGTVVAKQFAASAAQLATQKNDIEAIFAPLGGAELKKAAAALVGAGFEPGRVRLLGTGLWDEPGLAGDQPLLAGGWFAAAEPEARDRFVKAYQDSYGQKPPRLATLAYDATALAVVLARQGAGYGEASLTSPSGFAGLDGIFRLRDNGQIERGLSILEIGAKENVLIDPSPSVFTRR